MAMVIAVVVILYGLNNSLQTTQTGNEAELKSVSPQAGTGEYASFASCLTDAGLKMYGTEWCGYCKKQKELFGDAFSNIDYIDCDENRDVCVEEGIQGYPTWKFNGQAYPGVQQFETLSELTACPL